MNRVYHLHFFSKLCFTFSISRYYLQEHNISINEEKKYIVTWTTINETESGYKVVGFTFKEVEGSLANIEKLSIGKYGIQLGIAILLNLFIIFTAITAIR